MSKFDDKFFIGNVIRTYRKKSNITQEALAEMVDLSVQHISRIVSGKYIPSLKSFFELVKVLDINLQIFDFEVPCTENKIKKDLIEMIICAKEKELIFYKNILPAINTTICELGSN